MSPALAPDGWPGLTGLGSHRIVTGLVLDIRPLTAADRDRLQAHVRGLSMASRRNRYLGGLNELPAPEIDRLTRGDGNVLPFVAEIAAGNARAMIGELVLALDRGTGAAEFALSVADDWQRLGIGATLLAAGAAGAHRLGIHRLVGETLRTNDAMLALGRKAGMALLRHPDEARLVRLEAALPLPPVSGATFRNN